MKKYFFLFTLLLFSHLSFAQFGVTGGISQINGEAWEQEISENERYTLGSDFFNNGYSVGIDYWFRLKNFRVEFLPELRGTHHEGTFMDLNQSTTIKINTYGLYFNTNIYPFDLAGDCDCPTWSKEGPTLKKGLFVRVSPGVNYFDERVHTEAGSGSSSGEFNTNIGVGLGFDLGLSDLLTITPLAEYRWHSAESLDTYAQTENKFNSWFAGIRLGVRFDD